MSYQPSNGAVLIAASLSNANFVFYGFTREFKVVQLIQLPSCTKQSNFKLCTFIY
ncbi:hypothetical protein FM107_06760 [Sphingobacterium sp. JB170]|nr:hypothetical protein FM107_06760 [Sphingobacterium sp. JB170]